MKKEYYLICTLTFVSILISLVGVEGVLRIYKPIRFVGIEHQPDIYIKDEQNGYAYAPDTVGWMHRNFEIDNNVVINSNGFHDIERNSANYDDALRIVVVGDSFTASIHVPVSNTWTQVMERKLAESSQLPVEVVNLGLDGTGTDVHANILSSYRDLKNADIVILAFYANDIKDLELKRVFREVYDGYVVPYQDEEQRDKIVNYIDKNKPSSFARFLYNNFFLLRVLKNQFAHNSLLKSNFLQPRQAGIDQLKKYDKSEVKERLNLSLEKIISLAEQEEFVFIVMPVPGKRNPNTSMKKLKGNLSAEVFERLRVIDIVPLMDQLLKDQGLDSMNLYWKHDGHLNVLGNRIIGNVMAGRIDKIFQDELKRMQAN